MPKLGYLNHLKLSGFRSIKEMDLPLGRLNVLIGPNGAGKSNFINFFRFMNKLLQKDLQLYVAEQGGADAILHFGRKQTPLLEANLQFDPNSYACALMPTNDGRLVFKSESCRFYGQKINYEGGVKHKSLANPGSAESGLPSPNSTNIAGHVAGYIQDWKVYHFHDTSQSAPVKQPCNIADAGRLREQGENLAAFLNYIKKYSPNSYSRIVSTIQRAAPFFHDFILERDLHNERQIRLRWKHKGNDAYFDAHSLSDGTLRFICLTTLLLQPKLPSVILLDEPELGLHPYAIQLLGSMLRSASESTQIIASTQSVTLANEFEPENVIVVEHRDNNSQFTRLDPKAFESWLEDYRLGDLWEKNLLGGTP
jgi:predicted ATPase